MTLEAPPRIRDLDRVQALALLPMRYAPPRRRWFSRILTLLSWYAR